MDPPNLYPVKLYVYDLSKGLARKLSPIMLGEGAGAGGKAGRNRARRCQDRRPRCGGLDLGSGGDPGPRVGESPIIEGRDPRFGPLSPTFPSSRLNPGGRDGEESRSPLAFHNLFNGGVG